MYNYLKGANMSADKDQKLQDLIKAALDAEGTLSNLINSNQIKGVVTRAPIEKLIAATQNYKQFK